MVMTVDIFHHQLAFLTCHDQEKLNGVPLDIVATDYGQNRTGTVQNLLYLLA